MTHFQFIIVYLVFAYLVGSLLGALIFGKLFKIQDIRTQGSDNPGATNMCRVAGMKLGLLVFLFDMLKGALVVYGGYHYGLSNIELGCVAVAVCLGHIYPIFFKFRGGKGVSTAMGAMLPISWYVAFSMLFIWLVTFAITRYSSLSSIVLAVTMPLIVWYDKPVYTFPVVLVSCLLILRHYDNINRFFNGQENKLKTNKFNIK